MKNQKTTAVEEKLDKSMINRNTSDEKQNKIKEKTNVKSNYLLIKNNN